MKKNGLILIVILSIMLQMFSIEVDATTLHFKNTIASGNGRVYAIGEDGTLYYWGEGTFNDSAGDHSNDRLKPMPLMTNVTNVVASFWSGFAIKDDKTLWSIGNGGTYEGPYKEDLDPPVKVLDNVIDVAVAYSSALALTADGTVWEWGTNGSSITPTIVINNVKQISSGMDTFYAVKNDGTLWGWGDNYSGELGIKTKSNYLYRWSITKIMDDVSFVYGSGMNAFAIKTDGSLWGWGYDNDVLMFKGQLEYNLVTYSDGSKGLNEGYFTPVKLMEDVIDVAGRNPIAVIKKDHSLWVWGDNSSGQLGDGTTESRYTPEKLVGSVVDVTADGAFIMALKTDGTLWGCGTNGCGEMGIGSKDFEPHPELIQILDHIALPNSEVSIPADWAKEYVNQGIELGIIPIELQTKYDQDITRGEFVNIIAEVIKKVSRKDLNTVVAEVNGKKDIYFKDTSDENILNIASLGIIDGVGNNTFNASGTLTRQQAAKILMNTGKFLNSSLAELSKNGSQFSDDSSISNWAKEGVYFCSVLGIMNGTGNNNFSPSKSYTREMSIVSISRLYNLLSQ